FREAGDKRLRLTVARIVVARRDDEPLSDEAFDRTRRERVDAFRWLVTVVGAAEVDRLLTDLRERHAAAAARHASVRDGIARRISAERLCGDVLHLLLGFG